MEKALALAQKAKGMVSPNPLVGAVVVRRGKVVGTGYHKEFGKEHAEVIAIKNAGKKAKGADLYVTLEPCNHYGKQPPCTKSIISAGIRRVFAAMYDPNKKSLHGAAELKKHGIKVHVGMLEREAKEQNEFYIKSLALQRPFITIKIAITQNGAISWGSGKNKKITGKAAFEFTQKLRAEHDAALVGKNTVLKDNPQLTVRKNPKLNPFRIVLDSRCEIPISSKIFSKKGAIVACTKKAPRKNIQKLKRKGIVVIIAKEKRGQVDLFDLMKKLYKIGISSVLVEAGSNTASSFLGQKLFDRIIIIVNEREISGKGAFFLHPKVSAKIIEKKMLGKDLLIVAK